MVGGIEQASKREAYGHEGCEGTSLSGVAAVGQGGSPEMLEEAMNQVTEQADTSNGGQCPSLNSGFSPRRGWPIRSPN